MALHTARVYLTQSRHFTVLHRGWSFRLLDMAGNARRRATPAAHVDRQLDLPLVAARIESAA